MFETVTGPAFAASYLINDDASGLTDEDRAKIDAWLVARGIVNVVDVEDEPRFSWCYDFHFPQAGVKGGEVVEYMCELRA